MALELVSRPAAAAGTGPSPGVGAAWHAANLAHLRAGVAMLRLRLQRRVLWLRTRWSADPLSEYRGLVVSDQAADRLLRPAVADEEAAFYRSDPGVRALERGLEAAADALRSVSDVAREQGRPPALEDLAARFGLSDFARDTLLLAFAPELDPELGTLYAYAQDDATRRHATPELALALLARAEERLGGWVELGWEAPLRRFRLLVLEAGSGGEALGRRPLSVPERVQAFLRGSDVLAAGVSVLVRPVSGVPLTRAQRQQVEQVAARLEGDGPGRGPAALNLIGPPGSGRKAVATAICARLGLRLHALDLAGVAREPRSLPEAGAALERECRLSGLALFVDADQVEGAADPETRRFLVAALDRLELDCFIASRRRWPGARPLMPVWVPRVDSADRRSLWQAALAEEGLQANGSLDALVHQFELGPSGIADAVRTARRMVAVTENGSTPDPAALIWAACRERSGPTLDELAQRIEPAHGWDDIVLPEDAYQQLREIAAQVRLRARVYESWGFGAKLSRGRGISALFSGPSGTGKTLAAEVLAGEFDLALYRIDLSGVVSKYIGETEKNLKKVFDAAEDNGAVLFFDEADALFGKRSEVRDSHDRYANIEVNYLLQRMEDYGGLVIMATNMKSHLDPAFMRRLRFLVDFPFPDAALRRRIWEKSFPARAELGPLDFPALARMSIPGGNIRNIALNAAFLAADAGRSIGMDHIYHAARREYEKMEKLVAEAEFGERGRRRRR